VVSPFAPSFAEATQQPQLGSRRSEPGFAGNPGRQGEARKGGPVLIRKLTEKDWPAVRSIFEEGIATGQATFETEAPSWEDWDGAHSLGGLVAAEDGEVVGWAALSPYSARPVYAGVAEESIYVAAGARGRGVGRALLEALIDRSERAGIWTLEAGVFPENRASVTLHLACGFRAVGLRERIGRLNGEWRDVLLLERRSEVIR
jgi:L-amino acid N-acyltransferase YncA